MSILARFPSVLMAWRNLGRNRVRTALAALGIVIGVMSIASLGMAGVAINQQATAQLGTIANEVTITPGEDNPDDGVTQEQLEEIEALVTDAAVVEQKTNNTDVSARGQDARVSVTGVTEADELYTVSAGEAPPRLQSGALLSNTTAQELGLELGDPVEYDGQLYRIRGLLESENSFGAGGGGELVLPLSALSEQDHYDSVTIITAGSDDTAAIADRIDAAFNSYGRTEDVQLSIFTSADIQSGISGFMNTLELALLGIGSISLIVASVAILNVMLMSTVERRGEIGVLRAVGIRRGEVLRMILTEAAFLGTLGGLVGALASLAIGFLMFGALTGDPMGVLAWASARYLVYGFAFAVGASVLSGLYPAWKAANESPVEALRG
ncbi:ABC-type transport system permease protein (probable substrate macrolides) [Halobacterium hubeiense]|uniref:ABC-type transport system permease protein (Probable substrate macrolides) n=2 Tax=Halobacterium hubeiense TaxID=1407499 RepID=A0A0U5HR01_9EURY|nr:ABC transporter permease [Halobacterium hubeiense]CQH46473.1 ABC-type transport system permease protein (probable substrate macrolides) [Halobacterium hubeiense]